MKRIAPTTKVLGPLPLLPLLVRPTSPVEAQHLPALAPQAPVVAPPLLRPLLLLDLEAPTQVPEMMQVLETKVMKRIAVTILPTQPAPTVAIAHLPAQVPAATVPPRPPAQVQ